MVCRKRGFNLRTLIIDCSQLCFSSSYSLGELSFEEQKTGVIFGFLLQIFRLAHDFGTKDMVFCWDSKKRIREQMYPQYKADRKDNSPFDENVLHQIRIQMGYLRERVLPELGFKNSFIQTGLEADDLIANAVIQMPGSTVISNDSDLYQLLGFCEMYSITKKERFCVREMTNQFGIGPGHWVDALAIAGTHNNVKGIEGAGIVKAIQYLKNQLPDGKIKERIESKEGQEIIERNKQLIKLPIQEQVLNINFPEVFNYDNWIRVFQRYNFRSFMTDKNLANLKEDFFDEVRPRL